jgi:outer membrane protein assembly factor BamB
MKRLMALVIFGLGSTLLRAELPLGDPQFQPSRARPVGWRGDGTGCYPGATPPTEWDTTTGKGIVWKAPMPSWSQASPIVVNGRVIVLSEPHTILCYDAGTGKRLWHNSTDVLDAQFPSAEAKQKRELWEQIELGFAIGRSNYLKDNRETYGPAEQALGEQMRAKLKGTPYWDAGKEWVAQDPAEFSRLGLWINGHINALGRTQAPAISDGEWVWAAFGTHTVACYELATGKTRWMKFLGGMENPVRDANKTMGHTRTASSIQMAFTPAPQLVDGKLVLFHLRTFRALNPDTGQELWKTHLPMRVPEGFKGAGHKGAGTFAALRVGSHGVAVTPDGQAVRLADGKVVAEEVGGYMDGAGSSPIADDEHDMVYFFDATCGGKGNTETTYGVRLQWQGDKLAGHVVWKQPQVHDSVMSVLHRGLIYGPAAGVLDASTGTVRFAPDKKFQTVFCGWTLAGDLLCGIMDSGKTQPPLRGQMWRIGGDGNLKQVAGSRVIQETESVDELHQRMVQAWKEGVLSWRTPSPVWFHTAIGPNRVMGNHPFFHGNRMYVRTYAYLYCIGNNSETSSPARVGKD